MKRIWGEERCVQEFGGENPKERHHLEDLCSDGNILLKWILKMECDIYKANDRNRCGLFWAWRWIFWFREMRGNSELVEKPQISQERLCSMEIVMKTTPTLLVVNEVLHYKDCAIIQIFWLFQFFFLSETTTVCTYFSFSVSSFCLQSF